MAFEEHIAEHERRTAKALAMGGQQRLDKLAAAGRLNARQRIDYLFDPGSFLEVGMFARGEPREDWDKTPADGKVTGYGRIQGREAAVVSHDITVKSASSSPINVRKMGHMRRTAIAQGMPLVLLIDGDSASASEIVAGAIRDHRRGTIVGRASYGKWSVQSMYPASHGMALRLTTARFYSPSGKTYSKMGIEPDVVVTVPEDAPRPRSARSLDPDKDADLRAALEVLSGQSYSRR